MPRITVAVRVRPIDGANILEYGNRGANSSSSSSSSSSSYEITCDVSGTKQDFTFDQLFDETTGTQEAIFNSTSKKMVDEAVEGYNGCIFAYGQTGNACSGHC
jgi:kinesin family protein 15